MRIGINAALMGAQKGYRQTGISRYINELVYGLEGVIQPADKLMLLGRSPEVVAENPSARILWEQTGLPLSIAAHRLDVFHGPMHVMPMLTRVPGVITVHDVAFLKYPEQLPAKRRSFLIAATRLSARKAERVITVSRNTAADVREWLKLPEEKVVAIPLAPSPRVRPVAGRSLDVFRMKWEIERPYIIAVGTLEPRKNLPTLLRAFAKIKDQIEHDLVIVGPEGWLTGELKRTLNELNLGDRLRLTGFVSDEELGGWYSGADLFCFPSFYEGFGLPTVEAMRCGTPVLTSDTSAFPEVVDDAGILISPRDVDAWAETIRDLLHDPARLERMRELGLARADTFSWSRTAEETYRIYQEIAR
ncbi:MAG TPA: glycosyltransferase family 1 protein [Thermomicrobiales bacterium]|nr:glycosyltransferase family 1 protein [Thermomicrobiales bacterium]